MLSLISSEYIKLDIGSNCQNLWASGQANLNNNIGSLACRKPMKKTFEETRAKSLFLGSKGCVNKTTALEPSDWGTNIYSFTSQPKRSLDCRSGQVAIIRPGHA